MTSPFLFLSLKFYQIFVHCMQSLKRSFYNTCNSKNDSAVRSWPLIGSTQLFVRNYEGITSRRKWYDSYSGPGKRNFLSKIVQRCASCREARFFVIHAFQIISPFFFIEISTMLSLSCVDLNLQFYNIDFSAKKFSAKFSNLEEIVTIDVLRNLKEPYSQHKMLVGIWFTVQN